VVKVYGSSVTASLCGYLCQKSFSDKLEGRKFQLMELQRHSEVVRGDIRLFLFLFWYWEWALLKLPNEDWLEEVRDKYFYPEKEKTGV